jgi:ThiF family
MEQTQIVDNENDTLEHGIAALIFSEVEHRPYFYSLRVPSGRRRLEELLRGGTVKQVIDTIEDQEREYFQILHAESISQPDFESRFRKHRDLLEQKIPAYQRGNWVFLPWLSTLVHLLDHEEFFAVRTSRNTVLVTRDEQRRYYDAIIGVAGLSVGNSVALAIVLSGGARQIRLADFDTLSLSNTNRIRVGIESLGVQKVVLAARQIYAVNPYANVEIFKDGLREENLERFVAGPPALDVIIDEFDDIVIKKRLRQLARQHRIPVITGIDIADAGLVDIERYDLEPSTPFFHGGFGNLTDEELRSLKRFEIGRLLAMHVGPENAPPRMQDAFFEVGKSLVSWPQLGVTALLNGSVVAYCVRRIVNKQPLQSRRALISLDELLIPDFGTVHERSKRDEATASFKKRLNL